MAYILATNSRARSIQVSRKLSSKAQISAPGI